MSSVNSVVLVGRLTKDPVLRKTASGASITSFTVACNRRVKAEGQPTADFINTIAWNKTADIVMQYTRKGSLVGVEGRLQTRSYDDNSGRRVYVTEVVADSVQFLESKKDTQSNDVAYEPDYGHNEYQNESYGADSSLDIATDDLPF